MLDFPPMLGTIGILTGGGDAPGLNAVIRAVVKTATCEYGMRVIGIEDGFEGLIGATRTRLLSPSDVRGLLPRGGTILGTRNRGKFVDVVCEGTDRDVESVYQEVISNMRSSAASTPRIRPTTSFPARERSNTCRNRQGLASESTVASLVFRKCLFTTIR